MDVLAAVNGILGLTGKEVLMASLIVFGFGYAGQHYKAPKGVDTRIVMALMVLATVSAWALVRLPKPGHVHEWLGQCFAFSLMAWGAASGSAAFGAAPKTDSKG